MDEDYNVNDSVNDALIGYHDLFLQQLYNESIPDLYEKKGEGGEFDPDTFSIGMQRLRTPYSDFLQGQRNIMDALENKNPSKQEYSDIDIPKLEEITPEEEPPVEEPPVEEEEPPHQLEKGGKPKFDYERRKPSYKWKRQNVGGEFTIPSGEDTRSAWEKRQKNK